MDEEFWSLWPGVILGAEEDGDSNDDEGSDDENDENQGDDDAEGSDDSADDENQSKEDDKAKLLKALAAERRNNKKLDRENRRLKAAKATEDSEEKTTIETAQNREREANARAEKLAAGLLQRDINAAITRAAQELKFLDPDDAISGVDRGLIIADQDDEDPTDIDIDMDTVKAAVKALATKKPHYLSTGTDDGKPSGSPFGGKGKKKVNEEEALRELYPSL